MVLIFALCHPRGLSSFTSTHGHPWECAATAIEVTARTCRDALGRSRHTAPPTNRSTGIPQRLAGPTCDLRSSRAGNSRNIRAPRCPAGCTCWSRGHSGLDQVSGAYWTGVSTGVVTAWLLITLRYLPSRARRCVAAPPPHSRAVTRAAMPRHVFAEGRRAPLVRGGAGRRCSGGAHCG